MAQVAEVSFSIPIASQLYGYSTLTSALSAFRALGGGPPPTPEGSYVWNIARWILEDPSRFAHGGDKGWELEFGGAFGAFASRDQPVPHGELRWLGALMRELLRGRVVLSHTRGLLVVQREDEPNTDIFELRFEFPDSADADQRVVVRHVMVPVGWHRWEDDDPWDFVAE